MTSPRDITVTARLFARAREVAGAPAIELRMAEGDEAGTVWEHLPPAVRAAVDPATTRVAVNGAWATAHAPLRDGDEVALITPVSGG